MIRRLLQLLALLVILGACAAPQERLPRTAADPSRPSVVSIYYYISASLMHYSGDFLSAGELYRRALEVDSTSPQIRKQILINSAYAYINGQQTSEQTLAEFARARASQTFDNEMLSAAYSVYNEAGDQESLDWVINESIARFPTCRAYLQKFYLDYDRKKITDTKLLDKAYKLAGKNPEELVLCARMYTFVNPKRAIAILREARDLDPTPETYQLLNNLYLRNGTNDEAVRFYQAYVYPQDKASMLHFLQTSSKSMNFQIILSLQNEILITLDTSLLAELAFAAYMKEDENVLVKTQHALAQRISNPEEDASVAIFLLAKSLFSDAMDAPEVFGEMLYGTRDVDDMLLYRTLRYTMELQTKTEETNSNFYNELIEACKKRFPNSPLSRYIVVSQEELFTPADSVRASRVELSEYFVHRNRGFEEDWTNVITDYQLKAKHEEKILLLRRAIEKFHNNPLFLNDLGYSLLDFPDSLTEAGELIASAIAIEPENAYYQDSMAWYYYLMNDAPKALEHAQIPMQMDNIPGEIAYHMGMILLANNDDQNAADFLKKASLDINFPDYQEKAKAALTNMGLQP
jgi:Tfp pilus assembly protein PilF